MRATEENMKKNNGKMLLRDQEKVKKYKNNYY